MRTANSAKWTDAATRRAQVLMAVADYQPITCAEIAHVLDIGYSTAIKYVRQLRDQGIVEAIQRRGVVLREK
jgi:Mn-dependent DtxR family transcriptional regulator